MCEIENVTFWEADEARASERIHHLKVLLLFGTARAQAQRPCVPSSNGMSPRELSRVSRGSLLWMWRPYRLVRALDSVPIESFTRNTSQKESCDHHEGRSWHSLLCTTLVLRIDSFVYREHCRECKAAGRKQYQFMNGPQHVNAKKCAATKVGNTPQTTFPS